jgi:hypothetical protein
MALEMERLITDIGIPRPPAPDLHRLPGRLGLPGPRLPPRLPPHDQRPRPARRIRADVAAVADALPALGPALRKVMAGFFELASHQIDEVGRIHQRCAQRVKRFTAFGTTE